MSQAHLFILDCWDDLNFAKDFPFVMAKTIRPPGLLFRNRPPKLAFHRNIS